MLTASVVLQKPAPNARSLILEYLKDLKASRSVSTNVGYIYSGYLGPWGDRLILNGVNVLHASTEDLVADIKRTKGLNGKGTHCIAAMVGFYASLIAKGIRTDNPASDPRVHAAAKATYE